MSKTVSPQTRYWMLVGAVFVSGASQGMLLPLLSVLFEQQDVSSDLNGLNAAGFYLGIILASPFIEKPLQKYGYKPVLMTGLFTLALTLFLFPVWHHFWFWFFLRLVAGASDNMLHLAAQVWITFSSPKESKGRNIAIYGLSFAAGFAVGPVLVNLLSIGTWVPFITAGSGCLALLTVLSLLDNDYPHTYAQETGPVLKRYKKVFILGWGGLVTTFGYGFLEASLNGNFPIVAMRQGIDVASISYILPAFVAGSLITQIPLASLSDKIGRRRVILFVTLFGTLSFIGGVLFSGHPIALACVFLISGMAIGSLYSMGMTYISDLLPGSYLPLGNLLAGVSFSIGSMLGPLIGGLMIRIMPGGGFFLGISAILFLIFIAIVIMPQRTSQDSEA